MLPVRQGDFCKIRLISSLLTGVRRLDFVSWSSVAYGQRMVLDALPAEFIGTLTASTQEVERPVISRGPLGTKVVATVTGGTLVGPKINASLLPGVAAGDWVTMLGDGAFSLDVRLSFRTDDDADIYVTYTGFAKPNGDGTSSIRTAPRFETGDERYAWLNGLFCVAIGATDDEGVTYEIYSI